MKHPVILLAAAALGLAGTGLGAFGAHGLRELLAERGMTVAWETAVRYHLLHAVALLGLGALAQVAGDAAAVRLRRAAGCWVAGVTVFSGSLYGLALGGPRWLGPVTPAGGVLLLAGWGLLGAAALVKPAAK